MSTAFTKRILQAIILLIMAVIPQLAPSQQLYAAPPERPNILLIVSDDMGFECVEANGGTSYKTPRLNQLAETGMRFTHAYSQPICTPSRVQLMTGKYNQRNYIRFGVLDPAQTTFAQVLKKAGYKTCIAGKWQLEGGFEGPHHFGFDEYCLWQLTRRPSRYPSPGLEINGKEVDFPGKYGPDIASDFICDFIKQNEDQPFLVYYPMILPHWPFEPTPDSEEWDPNSQGAGGSQKHPEFFVDMVNYTDKMVGKIIDQLEASGLRKNTLIIFTGDNGTATSVTSMIDGKSFQGGKGSPTDAGMHVPMIANWPGKITSGVVNENLVDFTDIFPTLLETAGVTSPDDLELDGRSILPQLLGKKAEPREFIYCWYARNGGKTGDEFVQNKTFKFYRDGQYYNIVRDPREKSPLDVNRLNPKAQENLSNLKQALSKYDDTRVMLPEPYPKEVSPAQKNPKKNKQKNSQ
ncbi:sulfatase-like hydrolase/transferase [uncultured Rubinisphaera sp.]|uniref:sulfatase-like hydrolase/transferase n=1 Tax=uncultured Rubinisphaera sp. TaxID=1678686 RepID=UPI0030DB4BF7